MVEAKQQKESSNWWWFDRLSISNNNQKRSAWLQSTLSELDEKTKAMLKLIEEDADSFAQRAEMYYKKRPELMCMVEDFYRTHRSLAERYDQFKSESGTRLLAPWASPLSVTTKRRPEKLMSLSSMDKSYDSYSETYETEDFYRTHHRSLAERYDQFKSESGTRLVAPWASPLSVTKCRPEKLMSLSSMDKSYDSYSETYGTEELEEESDVEDPEPEEVVLYDKEAAKEEVSSGDDGNSRIMKLMEEIERLKEENNTQKEQLMQKDEEKRDVIRQLSLAMDLLREENVELRKRVVKESVKRQDHFEVNKLEVFWRRLFRN
ncbi:protein NETWORKED 3C [Coffea arabica]|uniref:Protein NETWORKED 3C n=1 Tax=Coffea arabica TaxID=13443 RepID=A0A6P6V5N4_COFAR